MRPLPNRNQGFSSGSTLSTFKSGGWGLFGWEHSACIHTRPVAGSSARHQVGIEF